MEKTYKGLTGEGFRKLFDYREGRLFWKVGRYTGSEAGCIHPSSRCVINHGRSVRLFRHIVIFMMHHDYKPEMVDHIDRNPLNDVIENLRASDRSQNARNAKYSNKTGYKGIAREKNTGKWRAFIYFGKKSKYLGLFETQELAARAHDKAAREAFGECAYQNFPDDLGAVEAA